ncbi:tyrosine-type recombinase/integrase [Acidocella sp.]|jgi:integrase|uniref:tyrosine-type recombinase/integrase n=1 Tax=Acidocella sp. TaxID=50710 RepID=UPI002D7E8E61|nr:tyrosine-type recombinase/integrase [Acidocella sp.]
MRMATPWRDPKTGIWKLRKRVPTRYWAVAGNKVIKISTGEADKKKALEKWPGVLQQWADRELEWERALNVVTLDATKAREVAATWAAWIASGAPLNTGGTDSDIFEPLDLPECRTPERIAVMWDRVEAHTDEALTVAGVSITPETRPLLVQTMARVVQGAYLRADLTEPVLAVRIAQALDPLAAARENLPDVPLPASAKRTSSTVTLTGIFEAWKAVATVKPRVIGETGGMIDLLRRFLGHDDAARVTTADFRRWRQETIAAGLNNNTWNNRFSMIRQVFDFAVNDGVLPNNPADPTLRLQPKKNDSPLPYSDQQAAQILNASREQDRPSRRWAHWIMAFTGMRVAEVLQLSVSDLREDGGIWYISVNEDGPGKSVKSSERRNIPIHPALVAEGLLKYAATLPQGGQLFPDKEPDKYGMLGGRSYNVVGRWIRRELGLTDERVVPNHSWRHRIQDELSTQDVPQDLRDSICGHAKKSTGAKYGVRGESLRRLAEAIGRIPVPRGVVVSELQAEALA